MQDDWLQAARSDADDDLREKILTGFKAGKPFTPYVPTLAWPPVARVLDFGCGLGRSFPWLCSVAPRVVGYDLPPMIARCRALPAAAATEALMDDWSAVRQERFDLIHASLVLQHIDRDIVRAALADFARIAPVVYVLTRTDSDDGANVFDLIDEQPALSAGVCHEVEHDPDTHQLRLLRRGSFDEARGAGPGRHFEVLLRATGAAGARSWV